MRRSTGALVIGLTLLIPATTALALGFGRIGHSTLLGQQLDFSVVLTTDGSELLNPQCVTAEVLVGDNPLPSTQVRSRVDMPADGGPALLRVVTNVRIDEPVASINVSVGCPPRLSRKFVVFIDPPVLAAPPTVAAAPAAAPAASGTTETPPVGLPVPPATAVASPLAAGGSSGGETAAAARRPASAAQPRSRPSPLAQQTTPGSAARSAAAAVPPRRVPLAAVRPAKSTSTARGTPTAAPRLKLEADWQPNRGPAVAAAETEQRLPLPLAAAAASGAGAPSDEQQRIRQLEQSIGKLLADARTTQASLAELQTRLREAESARFFNPWTYLLLALVAALLAAVLLLLWRQSRLKRESAWWAGGTEADATVAAVTPADPDPSPSPTLAFADEPTPPPVAVPAAPVLRPPAVDPPQHFVVAGPPEADAATPPFDPFATSTVAALRDMSVEELIDMEQQAEFFVVLGQDDAAIELLMSHVRHGGSTSPLAFLKLLEIYRRREERAPYERVRERFNRRFNAAAPEWDAAPGAAGRQLEDYPKVAASIEAVWPDPVQAMVLLESLLFRRDASAGTFDLPAYGELLFLYSQARDIAEHDVPTDTVDLLLPIGEEAPPPPPPAPPPSHQPPTAPLQGPTLLLQAMSLEAPPSGGQQPVGIDFDLDDFDAPAVRR